jgi:hypothetical protein
MPALPAVVPENSPDMPPWMSCMLGLALEHSGGVAPGARWHCQPPAVAPGTFASTSVVGCARGCQWREGFLLEHTSAGLDIELEAVTGFPERGTAEAGGAAELADTAVAAADTEIAVAAAGQGAMDGQDLPCMGFLLEQAGEVHLEGCVGDWKTPPACMAARLDPGWIPLLASRRGDCHVKFCVGPKGHCLGTHA